MILTMVQRALIVGLLVLLAGCSSVLGPATQVSTPGGQQTPLVSGTGDPEDDIIGARESPKIIASYGGIYSDRPAEIMLAQIVSKLLAAADQPNSKFTVTVLDTAEVNAFALPGGKIGVYTGLLQVAKGQDQLAAVIGHEVAHIANGDMVTMTLIQGVMNTFVVFLSRVIGYAVDSFLRKGDSRDTGPGIGYMITTLVLDIVLGFAAAMVVAWFSRHREFRADAGAAALMGQKQPMINALALGTPAQPGATEDLLIDTEADNRPAPLPTPTPNLGRRILLGASVVLIAFNLRPVFASLSVVLPEIIKATGLSATAASLLTTLPIVCLGVFAPLAPGLGRRFGTERTLLGCMVLILLGTMLRGTGNIPLLFLASAIAGSGIAVSNVLLSGLVKRDFAKQAALMMGLYTMAVCGGAASAAGLTVPIEHALGGGWTMALAMWALPAAVVTLVWAPQA
eukprot:gene40271-53228_t